jgi:CubicO group peptidase (beta-lactamase class C family)
MYENTLFDLESVTKVVATSTALIICIDRGLIHIDKPVRYYLPWLRGKGTQEIIIRHLATHTSGIKWGRICNGRKGCDFFKVLKETGIDYKVGSRYVYSNRNAILTGVIIESVTRETFGDFCRNHIFIPLGMHDTLFSPVPEGYHIAASRSEVPHIAANEDVRDAGRPIGTAGLFSTAHDLAIFCRVWLEQGSYSNLQLFSKESWKMAISNLSPVANHPRGLFWEIETQSLHRPTLMSEKAFGHSGYTGQSVWIDPEQDLYTVVLTNRNHPQIEKPNTLRGKEQYCARARIADAVIKLFE